MVMKMKMAVVAVTRQGADLAQKIKEKIPDYEIQLFLPAGKADEVTEAEKYQGSLRQLLAQIWPKYEAVICIMALGIVVRLIAPHIKDKRQDPAVVVLDEKGLHVISVLSGHLGGANALTLQIGQVIGAEPVITTATDVNNLPAIEMMAREMDLTIENFGLVKNINAAIVDGEPFNIYTDSLLNTDWPEFIKVWPTSAYHQDNPGLQVIITNKNLIFSKHTLVLRPKNLILGVGCRRNIDQTKIMAAIDEALNKSGYAVKSLKTLASIDIKADEAGLLQAAKQLQLPLRFFSADEINQLFATEKGKGLNFSQFVYDQLGVGGVCEAVTLLSSQEARLVFPKMKMAGVTVAIAEENYLL